MNAIGVLKPGGILVFDDYTWRSGKGPIYDPAQSIDAIRNAYANHFHTLDVGAQVWLRKKDAE